MAKKILIIEDDDFFRELLRKKLKSEGFEVAEATDGEKGAKMAKEKAPDLILLDLLMPGIDGFEVLSRIRGESSTASIPVIILSNLGQQEDIEKGIKLGANDYMIKSQFDINQVIEKINGLLKK